MGKEKVYLLDMVPLQPCRPNPTDLAPGLPS